ncbi:unnamed protein product [Lactuca saligna]|uniref:HECT domain-containing protein n=1 Tax=Lactuca saligna TaxID=75948 RepID=A0AA35VNH7_LACSI|nr:unnamed protein product [Lactuca saligna]
MAQKPRWGELEEEADGGDYDYLLPSKQITTTTCIRKIANARLSKRAMERRTWPYFGDVIQEDVGAKLTMVSTEEIIFEQPRAPGHVGRKETIGPQIALTRTWLSIPSPSLRIQTLQTHQPRVFEASSLQIFSPTELDYLLCGCREMWEADTLVEHIKFDHGYTSKSPGVINLLETMREFNPEQQRAVCQFVTGAPRLPPGGLAVLNPTLTIVRKFYLVSDIAMKELIAVATNREEHSMLKLQETEKSKHRLWFKSDSGTKRVLGVKLVEESNMKSLDSNLAALSARCNKDLELNLAKSFLSEMVQCTTSYPYNSRLEH